MSTDNAITADPEPTGKPPTLTQTDDPILDASSTTDDLESGANVTTIEQIYRSGPLHPSTHPSINLT